MATDAQAHDDQHGDDYHHHQHIATIPGNLIIFGALLLCTALTIGAYMVRLGEANLFVALFIAAIKATLVCTFFMHLKYEQRFNILFFLGSFLFVGVFVGYTLNDTDHRGDDVQGRRVDVSNGRWAFGTADDIATDRNGEFVLLDEDADGVSDSFDECEGSEGAVNEVGCTPVAEVVEPEPEPVVVADEDDDGVPDEIDECHNSVGEVDAVGCEPVGETLELAGLEFETGGSVLASSSEALLIGTVDRLRHSEFRFEISGHTDNSGNAAANQALSLERANAVKAWLVEHGLEEGRFTTVGQGSSTPVADNETPEGRARNRRIEFHHIE